MNLKAAILSVLERDDLRRILESQGIEGVDRRNPDKYDFFVPLDARWSAKDEKGRNTGIAFLVVCDMLLTGFDAPIEQVMYIDKRPNVLADNVACLDFSVAKGGFLCAYRWNEDIGE